VDRRDGAWLVAGEPGGHAGPEVAAVCDEAFISEADGHQLVPEPRHLSSRHSRRRGRSAESVPGQRRNDDRERVGWVCAVRTRVRKQSKDWQVLQERPGPPVGE
jgi:hypothetical protein